MSVLNSFLCLNNISPYMLKLTEGKQINRCLLKVCIFFFLPLKVLFLFLFLRLGERKKKPEEPNQDCKANAYQFLINTCKISPVCSENGIYHGGEGLIFQVFVC